MQREMKMQLGKNKRALLKAAHSHNKKKKQFNTHSLPRQRPQAANPRGRVGHRTQGSTAEGCG